MNSQIMRAVWSVSLVLFCFCTTLAAQAQQPAPGPRNATICRFTSGPRSGTTFNLAQPGQRPILPGSACTDGRGSKGVAVIQSGSPHPYARVGSPAQVGSPTETRAHTSARPVGSPTDTRPHVSARPVGSPAEPGARASERPAESRIQDTAYAPLYEFGKEAPGYGLYSYVIVLGSSDREVALIKTILQSTPAAAGLSWRHDQINLLLFPAKKIAAAGCGALPAGSPANCDQAALPSLAREYDHDAARKLLYQICGNRPEAMASFCDSAFGQGPFLLTYMRPASALDTIPPPFLFVDLSSVQQGAFAEYVAAYKAQVKSEDVSDRSKIDTMRLKVLNLILAGTGLINPIETAVADILHSAGGGADK
jgi:hypothetical protein